MGSEKNELLIQIILSLISGGLGAVLGGYLSYKGAMDSAKKTISHLYKHENEKRQQAKMDEMQAMLRSFIAESEENVRLCENWKVNSSKVILSSSAWSLYKGLIVSLPESLQERLIVTYSSISRYNSLVEYERMKLDYGHGALDGAIQQEVNAVKQTLDPMRSELHEYLNTLQQRD